MPEVITLAVAADEGGMRLDRWIRRRWPDLTQGRLEKLARTGQIRVDGGRVRADSRLLAGARVRLPPLPPSSSRVEQALSEAEIAFVRGLVIHEDDQVLALAKPAGLAVQGGTRTHRHLDRLLAAFGEGERRPRLVHRLDRETSGVLVLARTASAAAALASAFAGREAAKTYLAIVAGIPTPPRGLIDRALVKAPGGGRGEQMRPAAPLDPAGLAALTRYELLASAGGASLVRLEPLTGRTHQLRAHMALIGHPILGDRKYGASDSVALSGGLKLQLHAAALSLPHPAGGRLDLRAPAGATFAVGLRRFGFSADALCGD